MFVMAVCNINVLCMRRQELQGILFSFHYALLKFYPRCNQGFLQLMGIRQQHKHVNNSFAEKSDGMFQETSSYRRWKRNHTPTKPPPLMPQLISIHNSVCILHSVFTKRLIQIISSFQIFFLKLSIEKYFFVNLRFSRIGCQFPFGPD